MPHPKVKIADNSGNEVAVTSNALDVNIAGGASIDIGDVEILGHASLGNGYNNDIDSGDDKQITESDIPCKEVIIQASSGNTGIIYIGGENVTSVIGMYLYPSETLIINIDNVNKVYARASVNNQTVRYMYFN